jgi:hypothetical protein
MFGADPVDDHGGEFGLVGRVGELADTGKLPDGGAVAGLVLPADVSFDIPVVDGDGIERVVSLAAFRQPHREVVIAAVLQVQRPGVVVAPIVVQDLDERVCWVGVPRWACGRADHILQVGDGSGRPSGRVGGVVDELAVGAEGRVPDVRVPVEVGDLVRAVLVGQQLGEPVAQLRGLVPPVGVLLQPTASPVDRLVGTAGVRERLGDLEMVVGAV